MKSEVHKLVFDTLTYLKKEGHVLERKKILAPVPIKPKPSSPPPRPQQVIEPVKKMPQPPKQEQKKEAGPIFDLIKKHLPHIELVEKIPSASKVAILVFDKSDLPFLKNLAKAIQERFCSVSLLDGQKISPPLEGYTLVLAQENEKFEANLFIKAASFYQNDPKEKKQLWTEICTLLSPKSS